MKSLRGKNILITGASMGFGRGIALSCAQAGANVALVARSEAALNEVADLARAEGVQATVCVADLADEAQIYAAAEKAQADLGDIEVLVNNAGTNVRERSVQDTTSEQWRLLLDVNLTSAFLFTKVLMPAMIARKSGTVINVASMAAVKPSLLAGVAYSSAKLGLNGLTKVINEEGNPHNVRACTINPGVGNTPILDKRPAPPPPELRQMMLQPEDLGQTVVFLASLPQHVMVDLMTMAPTRGDMLS